MSDLHTATIIADVDLADDVELPSRKAAAAGLLRITLAKVKLYLTTALATAKLTVPPGGTTGQVLKKIDATDYNVAWGADNVGAGGATTLDGLTDVDTSTTPPTDGQALLFQNSSGLWKPGTVASGSGALVLLEQHTAAASATLDFAASISATYDEYLIEFVNVIPATNATSLYMRMSTNGGTSYDAGANYSYNSLGSNRFGTGVTGVDSGGTQIQLTKSAIDNTATAGVCGSIRLFSPSSTALHKYVTGQLSILTGGVIETQQSSGAYRSATAVNAFRFLFAAGNITSGIIRVYGVAK
jgi:hypothetical protein